MGIAEQETAQLKECANEWFAKLISPGTLFSIILTTSICYGTVQVINNQQTNDGKRIDQIQIDQNIHKVELSKLTGKVSQMEVLIENAISSIDRSNNLQADILKELQCVVSAVAVLKDRSDRNTLKRPPKVMVESGGGDE